VRLGRANGHRVEILAGLSAGDRFVSRGGFALKSELEKAGFEAGHAH
jgi:cobalt-zinc-cadmium efflux system membrane fusion protein